FRGGGVIKPSSSLEILTGVAIEVASKFSMSSSGSNIVFARFLLRLHGESTGDPGAVELIRDDVSEE
ncbi:hypothetical protein NPIL_678061, partial [Nephila pilipes]